MIEKLKEELAKAMASYASCGCRVYKDRIAEITKKIKDLEDGRREHTT